MSTLSTEQRLQILSGLVDGASERAIERMVGVSRLTINRFALRVGMAAWSLHNTYAHDLCCPLIESDEIWSYVGKKQARVTQEENAAGLGEAYTFVALAMPSRFVVTWQVGKRHEETADAFVADLRARLVVMPAMTSDGFAPYIPAIAKHLGPSVDYAQTIKNYGKIGQRDDHRYEPPREPFITKRTVFGAPDLDRATTSHVERNNGTMRHFIGRMRRLVYAFSKDPDHHRAAVNLAYCYYNLCWIPRTTQVSPALAVGAADHLWDLAELLDALLSVPETAPPVKKPLAPRRPEGPARELPNGRGFLRLVPNGSRPSAPPPASATPPAAPVPDAAAASETATSATLAPPRAPATSSPQQLDLFSWKPRPRSPQLSLFGLDFEPPK